MKRISISNFRYEKFMLLVAFKCDKKACDLLFSERKILLPSEYIFVEEEEEEEISNSQYY